jgi:hypothetical protein
MNNVVNKHIVMDLVDSHFSTLTDTNLTVRPDGTYEMFSSDPDSGQPWHLCYLTFKRLFGEMEVKRRKGGKPLTILETGTSSCGTRSTHLFDAYVKKFGGKLISVDLDLNTVQQARSTLTSPFSTVVHDDSVHFLSSFAQTGEAVDVVYLDSWDLDWYNYEPSATHGLKEYLAIRPKLTSGALLMIDDTPSSPEWVNGRGLDYHNMTQFYNVNHFLPGKGLKVLTEIGDTADKLLHQYQVLYKIK